jgi:chromosome partitioning protein
MSKIITFYNHKGGVSKTTTTFNIAHLLAASGKRVLVVDADPQCNMTELMLSQLIDQLDREAEATGQQNELPGSSLLSILRPRIDGAVAFVDTDGIDMVEVRDNLYLIRGDVALNSIEDSLAEAHIQRFSGKVHDKRTYVAMGDFLVRLAESRKFQVVFIDVGPSSGALTRTCFLACDAFFIPVAPDRFNVQAIGILASIIGRWLKEHAEIYADFKELGLPVRLGRPKFLGTVSQHFKILKGRPKPGYRLWMGRMPAAIREKLIPSLRFFSTQDWDLLEAIKTDNDISVTEIPDFGSLAPLMQEFGKPVFEIAREETAVITDSGLPWGGGTWTDAQRRMEDYKSKFSDIQVRIEAVS